MNTFEDWSWYFFHEELLQWKKRRMITKLLMLKTHWITGKSRVRIVLKWSSNISAYLIVLVTLCCDDFMHNIRCFHSSHTNLDKIVHSTISFKNAASDMTFWNVFSLSISRLPHIAVSSNKQASRLQITTAVRTTRSILIETTAWESAV